MSYIVAFVTFDDDKSEHKYPVQCFRNDLFRNDRVVIRKHDGKLKSAKFIEMRYLNWDCKSTLYCKYDECNIDNYGFIKLTHEMPVVKGMTTDNTFYNALINDGWTRIRSGIKSYDMSVFFFENNKRTCFICKTKNCIFLSTAITSDLESKFTKNSVYNRNFKTEFNVTHYLSHTRFNLYEGILRFSKSILANEDDLSRYFKAQGKHNKDDGYTSFNEQRHINDNADIGLSMSELHSILSGGGSGPAYLGDGTWISSSGRTFDD